MDDGFRLSLPERHIQRLEHQLGAQMGRHRPANDAAAPGVHNDREIQEAGPRTDVSDVGYPELIRPVSREISIDQKSSHLQPIAITVGGSTPFATTYTLQACSTPGPDGSNSRDNS